VTEELCDQQAVELKVHPPTDEADMADVVAAIKKVVANADELKQSA